ncbi:MAG: type II secretion system protein GspD, partial [Armatimonadota bacterium]
MVIAACLTLMMVAPVHAADTDEDQEQGESVPQQQAPEEESEGVTTITPEESSTDQQEGASDAQTAEETESGLVNNVFFSTPLQQALMDVGAQAGVTILVGPNVEGSVTLDLQDVEVEKALELMLMPNGMVFNQLEDGEYLVMAPDPSSPNFERIAETQIVALAYLEPKTVVNALPARYAEYVTINEASQELVISAPQPLLDTITDLIADIDHDKQQVMIEALVIETEAGAMKEFDPTFASSHIAGDLMGGIINYQSAASSETNAGGRDDGFFAGRHPKPEAGNILLGIRWMLQNERASIRANPSIVALDGEEASIKVGTDQYFSIVTGSAAYAYSRLEQVSAAISLNIEPHILPDSDEILCRLEPNVEDVVGKGEGGLPVITVRNAKTRLRLNNGEA